MLACPIRLYHLPPNWAMLASGTPKRHAARKGKIPFMRRSIVYIHPHLTMRAGATNFVLDTAMGLQERGWPVVIVTQQANPEIVGNRSLDIVELGGPLPSDPRHWLQLGSLERRVFTTLDSIKHKILFPQVHTANYWAFAYKTARPWVPCVWMCQEPSAFVHSWSNIRSLPLPMRLATLAGNPALQIVDRLLVAKSDRIIANSQFTAAAVRRVYGRDVDAIAYPGLRPEAFAAPSVERDCILSLGRLTRFKRVDAAIRGYAHARRTLGDTLPPLVIAGDGPELPALRALTHELSLDRCVRFTGTITDVEKRELYARALVFVSTAPDEPFGIACTEAMAAGVPVIAPDQGGPSETVAEGETGVLYRAQDATALGHQLSALVADRTRLLAMTDAARQRMSARYTVARTVESLERVLASSVA